MMIEPKLLEVVKNYAYLFDTQDWEVFELGLTATVTLLALSKKTYDVVVSSPSTKSEIVDRLNLPEILITYILSTLIESGLLSAQVNDENVLVFVKK
jgi:hypothetical protein